MSFRVARQAQRWTDRESDCRWSTATVHWTTKGSPCGPSRVAARGSPYERHAARSCRSNSSCAAACPVRVVDGVEAFGDVVELSEGERVQVGVLAEILAQETVGVLVAALLLCGLAATGFAGRRCTRRCQARRRAAGVRLSRGRDPTSTSAEVPAGVSRDRQITLGDRSREHR